MAPLYWRRTTSWASVASSLCPTSSAMQNVTVSYFDLDFSSNQSKSAVVANADKHTVHDDFGNGPPADIARPRAHDPQSRRSTLAAMSGISLTL